MMSVSRLRRREQVPVVVRRAGELEGLPQAPSTGPGTRPPVAGTVEVPATDAGPSR